MYVSNLPKPVIAIKNQRAQKTMVKIILQIVYIVYYIMSLEQIVDSTRTDKSTVHSCLPLYQQLFNSKKETAKNMIEVGIYYIRSIKLWSDHFTNAHVHGMDIMHRGRQRATRTTLHIHDNT